MKAQKRESGRSNTRRLASKTEQTGIDVLFVAPGAYHIGADTLGSLTDVAFKNPDGSKVVVAYNDGFRSRTFKVRWNGSQSFIYTLSAVATLTFNWSGRHSTATSWIA